MPKDGRGTRIDEDVPATGLTPSRAAELVVAAAQGADFVVAATGPTQYRFSRTYRQGWVVPTAIVGVALFGLGLLLLILVPKRIETCVATVNDGRRGVTVRLSGVLPQAVIDRIRVGLGGGSGQSFGATLPGTVAAPTQSVLPFPRDVARMAAAQYVPPPASTGSAFSSWAPIADPPPVSSEPVDAAVAREGSNRSGRPAGPAVRIDGESVSLSDAVVIGRNPAPVALLPGARLIAVGDPGLSKTHLAMRLVGATIEVCDLSSTNGTAVETGMGRRECVPGVWMNVDDGATVIAGDQHMQVGS